MSVVWYIHTSKFNYPHMFIKGIAMAVNELNITQYINITIPTLTANCQPKSIPLDSPAIGVM